MRFCRGCQSNRPDDAFGRFRSGKPKLTCEKCRNRRKGGVDPHFGDNTFAGYGVIMCAECDEPLRDHQGFSHCTKGARK